jgi:hypothetical protein
VASGEEGREAAPDGRGPAEDGPIGPIALYNLLDAAEPVHGLRGADSQLLVIDLLLVGNAYWYKWRSNEKGQPLSLYRLAPPYVKIVPGRPGPCRLRVQGSGLGQRKPLRSSSTK